MSTLHSDARVRTGTPRRYLGQLCKHFEHRLPVTFEERRGRIEFPAGSCEAEAPDDETLSLRVSAASEEDLSQLQDVIARHLLRFAFRETPEISWTRAPNAA